MLLEKRMGELNGVGKKIYCENTEGQNDELLIALDAIDVCYDDGLDDSRTADVTAHAPSHNFRSNDVEDI